MNMNFLCLAAALFLLISSSSASAETRIRCASTTSTQNSGLLDYILPVFEKKTGIKVDVIAVGTGAAIEIGKRGDADVVLVHTKEQELKAVEEGHFVNRHDVMYNDFVIIGPANDPVKIKGIKTAAAAFKEIAKDNHPFVSRGDRSGTHTKELAIWGKAGIEHRERKWYLEAGQGMEKTQRLANEKNAYTLTDRGTWLATKDRDKLSMIIVLEGDPALFNQYGVMAVNPAKRPHVKYKEAMEFIKWLISKEGQQAIASFKDKNGNQLFIPNAKQTVHSPDMLISKGSMTEVFNKAFDLILALDMQLIDIIFLSLKVSGIALIIAAAAGIPLGALMGLKKFPGRGIIVSLMNTFMGLPPVAVGLFLYIILSRSGPLGFMGLLYTPSAMVAAQAVLAFPIVASLSHTAVVNVDPAVKQASVTLGAAPFDVTATIIKEARYGIMSGVIAAFGRVTAEVGAVLIVGGNIAGYTRVMTTTIALEADKGNFELAVVLGIVLLAISLIVNLILHLFQKRAAIR